MNGNCGSEPLFYHCSHTDERGLDRWIRSLRTESSNAKKKPCQVQVAENVERSSRCRHKSKHVTKKDVSNPEYWKRVRSLSIDNRHRLEAQEAQLQIAEAERQERRHSILFHRHQKREDVIERFLRQPIKEIMSKRLSIGRVSPMKKKENVSLSGSQSVPNFQLVGRGEHSKTRTRSYEAFGSTSSQNVEECPVINEKYFKTSVSPKSKFFMKRTNYKKYIKSASNSELKNKFETSKQHLSKKSTLFPNFQPQWRFNKEAIAPPNLILLQRPKLERRRSLPDLTEINSIQSAVIVETFPSDTNLFTGSPRHRCKKRITEPNKSSISKKVLKNNVETPCISRGLLINKCENILTYKMLPKMQLQSKLSQFKKEWLANNSSPLFQSINSRSIGVQTQFEKRPQSSNKKHHRSTSVCSDGKESMYYDSLEEDEIAPQEKVKPSQAFVIYMDSNRRDGEYSQDLQGNSYKNNDKIVKRSLTISKNFKALSKIGATETNHFKSELSKISLSSTFSENVSNLKNAETSTVELHPLVFPDRNVNSLENNQISNKNTECVNQIECNGFKDAAENVAKCYDNHTPFSTRRRLSTQHLRQLMDSIEAQDKNEEHLTALPSSKSTIKHNVEDNTTALKELTNLNPNMDRDNLSSSRKLTNTNNNSEKSSTHHFDHSTLNHCNTNFDAKLKNTQGLFDTNTENEFASDMLDANSVTLSASQNVNQQANNLINISTSKCFSEKNLTASSCDTLQDPCNKLHVSKVDSTNSLLFNSCVENQNKNNPQQDNTETENNQLADLSERKNGYDALVINLSAEDSSKDYGSETYEIKKLHEINKQNDSQIKVLHNSDKDCSTDEIDDISEHTDSSDRTTVITKSPSGCSTDSLPVSQEKQFEITENEENTASSDNVSSNVTISTDASQEKSPDNENKNLLLIEDETQEKQLKIEQFSGVDEEGSSLSTIEEEEDGTVTTSSTSIEITNSEVSIENYVEKSLSHSTLSCSESNYEIHVNREIDKLYRENADNQIGAKSNSDVVCQEVDWAEEEMSEIEEDISKTEEFSKTEECSETTVDVTYCKEVDPDYEETVDSNDEVNISTNEELRQRNKENSGLKRRGFVKDGGSSYLLKKAQEITKNKTIYPLHNDLSNFANDNKVSLTTEEAKNVSETLAKLDEIKDNKIKSTVMISHSEVNRSKTLKENRGKNLKSEVKIYKHKYMTSENVKIKKQKIGSCKNKYLKDNRDCLASNENKKLLKYKQNNLNKLDKTNLNCSREDTLNSNSVEDLNKNIQKMKTVLANRPLQNHATNIIKAADCIAIEDERNLQSATEESVSEFLSYHSDSSSESSDSTLLSSTSLGLSFLYTNDVMHGLTYQDNELYDTKENKFDVTTVSPSTDSGVEEAVARTKLELSNPTTSNNVSLDSATSPDSRNPSAKRDSYSASRTYTVGSQEEHGCASDVNKTPIAHDDRHWENGYCFYSIDDGRPQRRHWQPCQPGDFEDLPSPTESDPTTISKQQFIEKYLHNLMQYDQSDQSLVESVGHTVTVLPTSRDDIRVEVLPGKEVHDVRVEAEKKIRLMVSVGPPAGNKLHSPNRSAMTENNLPNPQVKYHQKFQPRRDRKGEEVNFLLGEVQSYLKERLHKKNNPRFEYETDEESYEHRADDLKIEGSSVEKLFQHPGPKEVKTRLKLTGH